MTIGSTTPPDHHLWIVGATSAVRRRTLEGLELPPLLASVDAHRRLRGPYTAAGALMREIVPQAQARWPELVTRHDIELLVAAPELRAAVPASRPTLTWSASPEERTRFYPAAHTLRVAHGLTEFLVEHVRREGQTPRALLVENVDQADASDVELLAVLLRRVAADTLRVVVSSGAEDLRTELSEALGRYARWLEVTEAPRREGPARNGGNDSGDLAAHYVATDCTSDDPRLREAYDALPSPQRAALHDARATELESREERSLSLAAIPFHRERGSDPTGAGVEALATALEHCVLMGFYDAVVDLGHRSFALLDWRTQPEQCWLVTAKVATALTALDRPDEAADLYDMACAASAMPSVHLQSAYGRAMLYTRFYNRERQDHLKAKSWINTAIALSAQFPDSERRAFNLTFNENGLALIEMHLGDAQEALRLVTDGLQRLDDEIGPDEQTLHRSVLRYNRAQLLARIGPPHAALDEYTKAIAADPNHSEYYFERAGVHRRIGDWEAALSDYEAATRLSPPYPEPYYNRADLALELGDLDTALADFSYVLELEPSFLDAYVNRASVLYELGEVEAARRDVAAGLALDPEQAHLLCLKGLIAHDDGRPVEACEALDAALERDPSLAAAWSNRGALHFDEGEVDSAIACLGRALELDQDSTVLSNRGLAYESAGRWAEAVADYTAALGYDGADRGELHYRRGHCLLRYGDRDAARLDFEECARAGGTPYAGDRRRELEALAVARLELL